MSRLRITPPVTHAEFSDFLATLILSVDPAPEGVGDPTRPPATSLLCLRHAASVTRNGEVREVLSNSDAGQTLNTKGCLSALPFRENVQLPLLLRQFRK